MKQTLSFDDVLLVPQSSDINSRSEVSLERKITDVSFNLPIISSPMDTVTETDMALKMFKAGGLGIIHRYNTIQEQTAMVGDIRNTLEEEQSQQVNSISAAIGTSGDFFERAQELYNVGARILCIDVAHGHHKLVKNAIKKIRGQWDSNVAIIAGNVATKEAYLDLSEWGADAVRVGIGGGSICSTRIQTGHGVPTFQSVYDCKYTDGAAIIADGGIKTAGDIVKALAAGADFVMLGSMLAGTEESPGSVFAASNGKRYKVYRGMASVEAQVAWRGNARSLEGVSTTIPFKGSVEKILSNLAMNIRSGLSYTGVRNITQLQSRCEFITQTAAGRVESGTHILNKNV
tara:strand:- start:2491 stop:3528 length:1038 start_codon:yes stop_codon:yes gene_type:complete